MKRAVITGITGQDGSYLARLLLAKGYQVVGMVSQKNDIGMHNIQDITAKITLQNGDLLDADSLQDLIKTYTPTELYNLAGITFIPTAWKHPVLTHNVNALGVTRMLQAIKQHSPHTRFFQASSAKMFGNGYSYETKAAYVQTETTKLQPLDPYAISKVTAHLSTKLFRSHYGLYACCGILYNHESPHRGLEFVTRKITHSAVQIKLGKQKQLALGNLQAQQDWGWAPDYVEAMWRMLQQETADDFVLATGKLHSVQDICKIAFEAVDLDWQNYVVRDEKFYRQTPDKAICGDPAKATKILGWNRSVSFKAMIKKMVEHDMMQSKQKKLT